MQSETGSSLMVLRPGAYSSTGHSRNEIGQVGMSWAVCSDGESAFEMDNKTYWANKAKSYSCRAEAPPEPQSPPQGEPPACKYYC